MKDRGKMSYSKKMISGLLAFSCFYIGCGDTNEEERKQQWINKEISEKIEAFKKQKKEECLNEILLIAEAEIDSILSQKDLFQNLINQDAPSKPIKPQYIPLDSNAIQNHKVKKVL